MRARSSRDSAAACPVLLYHRLAPSTNGYGVAPADFAAQMQRLHGLGFQAISLDQYVRFIRGKPVDLPPRPILITFDDGFAVLVRGRRPDPRPVRLERRDLRHHGSGRESRPSQLGSAAADAGDWALADRRARRLRPRRRHGRLRRRPGPLLRERDLGERRAGELPPLQAAREPRHRARPEDARATNLPGWRSHGTFAVPFNNYGQHGSNDPRIGPWLGRFLKAHFAASFLQDGDGFSTPRPGFENRIFVPGGWDVSSLEGHLLAGRAHLAARG